MPIKSVEEKKMIRNITILIVLTLSVSNAWACQFKIGTDAASGSTSSTGAEANAASKTSELKPTLEKLDATKEADSQNPKIQDQTAGSFKESALPQTADSAVKFVPAGWMIEETVTGDLNNDSIPDAALKLIEKMPAGADKDAPPSRSRALLILLKNKDGMFERAAVAKKLLQCTGCGGAFYGVSEASANVEISRGVLIVRQDHGSRNVVEQTFRFRYDQAQKRFALIGYDESDRDRATGETRIESTNFLTGVKITEVFKYDEKSDKEVKKQNRQTKIPKTPKFLEQIDGESFGGN